MYTYESTLFEQVLARNKPVCIFGTGSLAEKFIFDNIWLYEHIDFFVDNNPRSEVYMNKKVLPFREFEEKDNLREYFIVVASSFYNDIFKQLESIGLQQSKHYIQVFRKDIDDETTKSRIINGVHVGKYSYGYSRHCYRHSILKKIGSFTSINESVRIGEVNHPLNLITTHPILYIPDDEVLGYEGVPGILPKDEVIDLYTMSSNKQIVIGNDVWIGANTVILPGVEIGDGAVIGAGAIVTKDVPPYAIMGGVPAKIIRYRFTPEEIEVLIKIKWWNWEIDEIKRNADLLKNPALFFEKFGLSREIE